MPDQIKHMVERFLQWKLPEHFNPDGGISFKRNYNENTPYPMKHEPVGTNLFGYDQAEEMVRYMLEGLAPVSAEPAPIYVGEVFDCPATSVVDEKCVCKPSWGHRSFRVGGAEPTAPTAFEDWFLVSISDAKIGIRECYIARSAWNASAASLRERVATLEKELRHAVSCMNRSCKQCNSTLAALSESKQEPT